METKELKKCKNCGSTDRVWYEGYCQNCYGEIYKQRQAEIKKEQQKIEEEKHKRYIENQTIKHYSYEPPKQKLSMNWFNFYVTAMPFFIIIYALNIISTFIYNAIQYNNVTVIITLVLDAVFCYYQYYVYKQLKNQIANAVENLLIVLVVNLFFKMLNVSVENPDEYVINVIVLLIYYVPNAIYFYKRKDVFRNDGLYLIKKSIYNDIIQQYNKIIYYSDKIDFFIQQCSLLIDDENDIIATYNISNIQNKINKVTQKIDVLCCINDDLLAKLPNNQKEIFQNYQDVIIEIFAYIERLNNAIILNQNIQNEFNFLNEQILKLNSIYMRISSQLIAASVIEKCKIK